MKSYARLGEQCGSVRGVHVAMGSETGSLKEEAHPMLVVSGLQEYHFGPGRCADSLIAKGLSTIDLMNSYIQVGLMMNPSLYPNSVDSRVGNGCLDSLAWMMMGLHPPLDSAVMVLRSLDHGGPQLCLLLVSIVAMSLGHPESLE